MDSFIYLLPRALTHKTLQRTLPKTIQYRITLEKEEVRPGILLDTFDEEMLHSGKMLFQCGEMLLLADLRTGQLMRHTAPEQWSFAADLAEGPMKALLLQVSSLRAFLPVAKVELCLERGLLLDDEGKTRARFENLAMSRGRKTVAVGSTQSLRGYDRAHIDLRKSLERIGASSCNDVRQVQRALGIKQEKYTAKPVIPLNPEAPVKESAKVIIQTFIQTARDNEKGLIADYDTEFLHDYRVCLRKVRSVLSLFKGVYNREDTERVKQDFSSLMQKTNALRDLDVYLLNKKKYFEMVPADTHEGLEILFDYIAEKRKKEQKRVSKFIRSTIYRKEIERLTKLFADDSLIASGPKGDEKSLVFSSKMVLKRYDKVCKIARNIDEETEDAVIHELRIHCKKLRYLMEFFAPIFPESEMRKLIKALKSLQDNLGNFNDYSVQQMFLRRALNENMTGSVGWKLKVAESVGALTAMLYRLQQKERRQVVKNFADFDSLEIRTTFTTLFHTKERVDENNSLLQQ